MAHSECVVPWKQNSNIVFFMLEAVACFRRFAVSLLKDRQYWSIKVYMDVSNEQFKEVKANGKGEKIWGNQLRQSCQ